MRGNTSKHRARRRSAFTLVELLVVVAIISLLLAMLLPALEKARAVARVAVCGAIQRQVGVYFIAYVNETPHGVFPARYEKMSPWPPSNPVPWYELIIAGGEADASAWPLWCPDDPNEPVDTPGGNISYGYNHGGLGGVAQLKASTINPHWYTSTGAWADDLGPPGRLSNIHQPAATILTLESTINSGNNKGWFVAYAHPDQANGVAYNRHEAGCNVLFTDGHVEIVQAPSGAWRSLYDPEALGDIRHDPDNKWDRH